MTNTVICHKSSFTSAPAVNSSQGSVVDVLDATLVNGFGSVTLSSLVVASGVATATHATAHGFVNVGSTGGVITIAGATPSELNGNKRITVTSATEFTFATTSSDQTASGTITAKQAAAGWEIAYTDTYKRAYRSLDTSGLQFYLYVDDSYSYYCRIRGYESMTSISSGTDPFPADIQISGGAYIYKNTAIATRDWIVVADTKNVYMLIDTAGTATWNGGFAFTEPAPFLSTDAFACNLVASINSTGLLPLVLGGGTTSGSWITRAIDQTTKSIVSSRFGHGRQLQFLCSNTEVYPPTADGIIRFSPVEVWEGGSSTVARGILPGVYSTPCVATHDTPLDGITGLTGRTLLPRTSYNGTTYGIVFDITGPW